MTLISISTMLSPFVIVPRAEAYVISISRQFLSGEEPAKKGRGWYAENIWCQLQETLAIGKTARADNSYVEAGAFFNSLSTLSSVVAHERCG
jgi:hypothetical protein